jgi:hypothetical protein
LPQTPIDPDDGGTAPNGRGEEAVSSVSAAEKEPKPENPNKIRQGFKVSTVSSTMTTPAATAPLTDQKNPLIPCHLTDKEVETALFTEAETDETVETASKNPSLCLSFAVSASEAVAETDETAGATDQPENLRQPCQSTTDELEVKVVCENCGAWRRIPPDAFLLTDPRCPVCGEAMRPEPEDDNPKGDAPPVEDREDNLSARKGDPPTDLTKPVPHPSPRLPDGVACRCGGRLRSVGRKYLCDRCQRPLPAACQHCYRVLFVVAEGRAMCATCQVVYAFWNGHWREVSRDGSAEVSA